MPIDLILQVLQGACPEGKGWRSRCPNLSHEERHPSFFLYPKPVQPVLEAGDIVGDWGAAARAGLDRSPPGPV